jgi:hypothetical protein
MTSRIAADIRMSRARGHSDARAAGGSLGRLWHAIPVDEVVHPGHGRAGVQGKRLVSLMDGAPNDGHNTAIHLSESGVAQCGERVKSPGVEENDFVTEVAVDAKGVLDRGQQGEVTDFRPEFLAHFAHDGLTMRLTEFDGASDQAIGIPGGFLRSAG